MGIPILLAGAVAVASSVVSFRYGRYGLSSSSRNNHDSDGNDGGDETTTSTTASEKIPDKVQVTLPEWAQEELPNITDKIFKSDEEMMALAIHLSRRNVEENTGGPFGSAIFERNLEDNTATLVSIGMNRVVPLSNSTLHGEMVAIQLAQSRLQNFSMQCIPIMTNDSDDDDDDGGGQKSSTKQTRQFELFTSCEPCAMCLGATLWSGVSRLVCGATKSDAEKIGFDEGPVYEKSYRHLQKSGVMVKKNVLQREAAKVLQDYGKIGVMY